MSIDATNTVDLAGFERALAGAEAATGSLGDLAREAAGVDIRQLRLLRRSVDRAVFADDAPHTVIRGRALALDRIHQRLRNA